MDLHWLPVHQRVTFKILILTYQAYHGTAPQYLCELIVPYVNTCNLRSNNKLLIVAPSYGTSLFSLIIITIKLHINSFKK